MPTGDPYQSHFTVFDSIHGAINLLSAEFKELKSQIENFASLTLFLFIL